MKAHRVTSAILRHRLAPPAMLPYIKALHILLDLWRVFSR